MFADNDAFENYEFVEELHCRDSSKIHVVSCKRGRLRGRLVALKVKPKTTSFYAHQSLCHTHIVAMYSSFATLTEHVQVLELCPNGDLQSFIESRHPLSEAELRGLVLNLVDALTYLRKQRIIHRDIGPKHALVTDDYRVKLSHLDQAIELPFGTSMSKEPFQANVYSSPEIVHKRPYTYSTDLWSLGCLIIACINYPKLPNLDDYSRTLKLRNSVPSTMSSSCSEFVIKLLQPDTSRRIPLSDISSHPFLSRDLHVSPLRSGIQAKTDTSVLKHIHIQDQRRILSDPTLGGEKFSLASNVQSDPDDTKSTIINPKKSVALRKASTQHPNIMKLTSSPQALTKEKPECGVAIGTTRPELFTTNPLQPQTKKVAYGHVVILPSFAVLIDFREGQRREGGSGNQVLVVSPDGNLIKIYDAPHLSTPCCLVEPVGAFALTSLPSIYWQTYNEASAIIEQMKRKTSKLVLHSPNAKCTLMANAPKADIELLYNSDPTPIKASDRKTGDKSGSPNIRVHLSRRSDTIEFACRLKSAQGEEWTKKNFLWSGTSAWINSLSNEEHDALDQLLVFLKSCEAVELADMAILPEIKNTHKSNEKLKLNTGKENVAPSIEKESSTRSTLHSLRIKPRPIRTSFSSTTVKPPPRSVSSSTVVKPLTLSFENTTTDNSVIQTKFLSETGWCIRYASNVSQAGRYRILFFDGVEVIVDVDEDWVEVKSLLGSTTRHTIKECHLKRDVGDRMKAFKEFVSMFDESV